LREREEGTEGEEEVDAEEVELHRCADVVRAREEESG